MNEKKDLIKLNAETGAIGLSLRGFLEIHVINIVAISTVIWTLISYALLKLLNLNIFVIIIGFGTFSLAMAFSGNDLVNFIGVPIAAWNSYQEWILEADAFSMAILTKSSSNVFY